MFNKGIDFDEVEASLGLIGRSMADMYRAVGYSRQSSNNYRKQGYIPVKFASNIADFFDIAVEDVMKNKITPALEAKKLDTPRRRSEDGSRFMHNGGEFVHIPMVSMGLGIEEFLDIDNAKSLELQSRLLPPTVVCAVDKNTVIARVVGNAMSPQIENDDTLVIEMINNRNYVKSDGLYIVRIGKTVQVRQVQHLDGDNVNLICSNKDYPILNPTKEGIDFEIIGKPFLQWRSIFFPILETI